MYIILQTLRQNIQSCFPKENERNVCSHIMSVPKFGTKYKGEN